jgi:hypothetical protein
MGLVESGGCEHSAARGNRLHRIPFAIVLAVLAICAAGSARAQTVSLIGAWQFCNAEGCTLRFAFRPNRTVIKQYVLAGATVTAYGRYERRRDTLRINWTRFSPRRVCPSSAPTGGRGASCQRTAEPDAQGPIRFEGFNTLVWTVAASQPLRLVRIEY